MRSVGFLTDETLIVGSIGGSVFAVGLPGFEGEALKLAEVEGSITCVRSFDGGRRMLLSTTSGYVYCYEMLDDTTVLMNYKHFMHKPGESSEKFGSLRRLSSHRHPVRDLVLSSQPSRLQYDQHHGRRPDLHDVDCPPPLRCIRDGARGQSAQTGGHLRGLAGDEAGPWKRPRLLFGR